MSIGVIGNTSVFGTEESRFEPLMDNFDLVAQLVEHLTFNEGVAGSNPSGITFCELAQR